MKKILVIILAAMAMVACAPKETQPQVGTVVYDTINNVPCRVYLPHGYKGERLKVKGERTYPVLYLHHGMWGNEHDWTEQGHLLHWMDSLLQLGQVREMVVVMPDNCPHRETSEEERANAMSGEWVRNFAQFMAETERKYNVSDDPSLRAIAGLSMGGFHSMHVSHYLHGQFAYVGLFSPAIRIPIRHTITGKKRYGCRCRKRRYTGSRSAMRTSSTKTYRSTGNGWRRIIWSTPITRVPADMYGRTGKITSAGSSKFSSSVPKGRFFYKYQIRTFFRSDKGLSC